MNKGPKCSQVNVRESVCCVQINAQNSSVEIMEVMNLIRREKIGVAFIQEPYCYRGRNGRYTLPEIGSYLLIAEDSERFRSCIIINNAFDVVSLGCVSSGKVVAASVQ